MGMSALTGGRLQRERANKRQTTSLWRYNNNDMKEFLKGLVTLVEDKVAEEGAIRIR